MARRIGTTTQEDLAVESSYRCNFSYIWGCALFPVGLCDPLSPLGYSDVFYLQLEHTPIEHSRNSKAKHRSWPQIKLQETISCLFINVIPIHFIFYKILFTASFGIQHVLEYLCLGTALSCQRYYYLSKVILTIARSCI